MKYTDGSVYEGRWNNDRRHGPGVLTLPDGTRWVGEFRNDEILGERVRIEFTDGSVYEGGFRNGFAHGSGSIQYSDGTRFTGEFFEGNKCGQGTQVRANGETYSGHYNGDKRAGRGTCRYPDGSVYRGEWLNDVREGNGTFEEANGCKYEGAWKDDQRNGQGIQYYEDGSVYTGSFANNLREGTGICKYSDGSVYEGSWHNDVKHGHGSSLQSSVIPGTVPLTQMGTNQGLESASTAAISMAGTMEKALSGSKARLGASSLITGVSVHPAPSRFLQLSNNTLAPANRLASSGGIRGALGYRDPMKRPSDGLGRVPK